MAASEETSTATDGPVLNMMNKRLRSLRKKYNRILQMEDALSQGKPLNKEQDDVLRSKPGVIALIDEYEKLRQPLSTALQEELQIFTQQRQPQFSSSSAVPPVEEASTQDDDEEEEEEEEARRVPDKLEPIVKDLLNLIYFGSLFDVKPQSDFTSTMLTRTHERGCCLTYDYVTDDAASDLLEERDLDLISLLGSLVISRPVHSSLSHKNALRSCLDHAKLWIANSDQPIETGTNITYAGLKERLNKILASDYFTTTPEMKAPVEVAAAAEQYATCQVPVYDSWQSSVPVETEEAFIHYQKQGEGLTPDPTSEMEKTNCSPNNMHALWQEEEISNFQGHETDADQSDSLPIEDIPEDGSEKVSNPADVISVPQDQQKLETEMEEQNEGDVEFREQQYIPRRDQNQRGGRGGGSGRRGYPNGRGGRSGRGGGGYQNGRNQYYDQPGNYYPRNNYYSTRGRNGRGGGGNTYNNHGGHAQADEFGL